MEGPRRQFHYLKSNSKATNLVNIINSWSLVPQRQHPHNILVAHATSIVAHLENRNPIFLWIFKDCHLCHRNIEAAHRILTFHHANQLDYAAWHIESTCTVHTLRITWEIRLLGPENQSCHALRSVILSAPPGKKGTFTSVCPLALSSIFEYQCWIPFGSQTKNRTWHHKLINWTFVLFQCKHTELPMHHENYQWVLQVLQISRQHVFVPSYPEMLGAPVQLWTASAVSKKLVHNPIYCP